MKKQFLYRIALAVAVLCCGALTASAQSTDNLLNVKIPFAFQLGETQFPAGAYTFTRISNMPNTIVMRGKDDKSFRAFSVLVGTEDAPKRNSLVFHAYGEKRFLSRIEVAQQGLHFYLSKPKSERKLARTNALSISRVGSDANAPQNTKAE